MSLTVSGLLRRGNSREGHHGRLDSNGHQYHATVLQPASLCWLSLNIVSSIDHSAVESPRKPKASSSSAMAEKFKEKVEFATATTNWSSERRRRAAMRFKPRDRGE